MYLLIHFMIIYVYTMYLLEPLESCRPGSSIGRFKGGGVNSTEPDTAKAEYSQRLHVALGAPRKVSVSL